MSDTRIIRILERQPVHRGGAVPPGPRFTLDLLQVVAIVAGAYLIVTGLVALARAGFDDIELFDPHVEVGGLHTTPLLAIITLIVGLLLLYGGVDRVEVGGLRFGGAVIAIVGVVWMIEADAFHEYLGVHEDNGFQHLVIGVLLLVASFVPPIGIGRQEPPPPPV